MKWPWATRDMPEAWELLASIQSEFRAGRYRLTVHALQEAAKDALSVDEIVGAVLHENAAVIEDYRLVHADPAV